MRTLIATLVVLFAVASAASAQYSTTSRVQFRAPSNATTVADATGLTYNLRIDGGSPVALSGVTCTVVSSVINCESLLPASVVPFLNVLGTRSVTLSAAHATAGESAQSAPFVSLVPPTVPLNLALTR